MLLHRNTSADALGKGGRSPRQTRVLRSDDRSRCAVHCSSVQEVNPFNFRSATQTLGEEYTDIWQHSQNTARPPSAAVRLALILLPTCPSYLVAKLGQAAPAWTKTVSTSLEVLTEINLAVFYLKGTYYDLSKRMLRVKHVRNLRP
jgi:hypothetical protein